MRSTSSSKIKLWFLRERVLAQLWLCSSLPCIVSCANGASTCPIYDPVPPESLCVDQDNNTVHPGDNLVKQITYSVVL
jgi:hypothetical protein